MKHRSILALAAAGALAVPAGASAHVTVQPSEVPAGGFTRIDVRVPNEKDDEGTTKVRLRMPPGFFFVSYEPKPGWTAKITKRKLDKPVEEHGEQITEEVDTVTFTGKGKQGVIGPGQFVDFGLSVGVPEGDAGTKLKFPAIQTYQGGENVRWIGPEDGDSPAPVVTLTAAQGEHGASAEEDEGTEPTAAQGPASEPAVSASDVDDKASKGLAIGALIVGGLGLLVGLGAFAASRRRTA